MLSTALKPYNQSMTSHVRLAHPWEHVGGGPPEQATALIWMHVRAHVALASWTAMQLLPRQFEQA